jgi:hypothetical protein
MTSFPRVAQIVLDRIARDDARNNPLYERAYRSALALRDALCDLRLDLGGVAVIEGFEGIYFTWDRMRIVVPTDFARDLPAFLVDYAFAGSYLGEHFEHAAEALRFAIMYKPPQTHPW